MEMIFGAPQFYVQGPGIIAKTGKYLTDLQLDGKLLLMIDVGVKEVVKPMLVSIEEASIDYDVLDFADQYTLKKIALIADESKHKQYCAVVGVGGGKPIDASKRVGWSLGIPFLSVPTSIATDAATSRTSVAYTDDGELVEDKTIFNPAGIFVDSAIIVRAPIHLFGAGMADALSKRYEYKLSLACGFPNWYDASSAYFIDAISKEMHELLLRNGRYLKECFREGVLNETVERSITAMLLMSRLVWDSGGLRGAHDLFEEFNDAGYGKDHMHGEIVGYFDLVQLLVEQYPDNEFYELYTLYRDLGIPLKISDFGFPIGDADQLDELTTRFSKKCGEFNWHPGDDAFKDALLKLEKMQL
ncbi:MAG TPA: iron-containing alcohol dehydrogenase [Bacillota bacterium]|jgi:glycerol dehydrogenase|nr:glycerol dehydrogenase [Fastidiosipila sp.]HPX93501.1 iron-containing alcohol dehydrogenase [Bacillota bacterium]HQB81272.1 iron-containing alcohol dehydrogenase [Bacillota bacterium]